MLQGGIRMNNNKSNNFNDNEKSNDLDDTNKEDNMLLKIKNIQKSYNAKSGKLKVIKNITLTIKAGEIVGLIGPSGCGKTTLLNIVAGMQKTDRGQVIIKPGSKIGYVFQEPRLLPWKTVEENIDFVQSNFLDSDTGTRLKNELLSAVELDDFRDSYPAGLSGGMKQRLEFIRALSIKPNLLLMDEPFKSLDISLKLQLRELLLNNWKKESYGILYITHDPEDAVLLADRIYTISEKPTELIEVFEIDKSRDDRTLKDENIYSKLQEILSIITTESCPN